MNIISIKALKLLQNIYSFKRINKILIPLSDAFIKDEPYQYFEIEKYYNSIIDENISLLIELSIFLRKKAEKLQEYKISINSKVKYSNVAKYDNNQDVSFKDVISKIIHANSIEFIIKSEEKIINLQCDEIGKNCEFTGQAVIEGKEKDNSSYKIIIDVNKFCANAFMLTADEYYMQ